MLSKNPLKVGANLAMTGYEGMGYKAQVQNVADWQEKDAEENTSNISSMTETLLGKRTLGEKGLTESGEVAGVFDKTTGHTDTPGLFQKDGTGGKVIDKTLAPLAKGVYKGAKVVGDKVGDVAIAAADKILGERAGDVVEGGVNLVKGGVKVGEKVVKKTAEAGAKAVSSSAAKIAGSGAAAVGGILSVKSGTEGLLEGEGTTTQNVGHVAEVAGGATATAAAIAGVTAAATGTAAANFWNPVGWVAGAVAIGGSLLAAFGGDKGGGGGGGPIGRGGFEWT